MSEREATAVRAYRVAYDGRTYRGFQRQPDVSTVSDAILDALRDLAVLEDGGDADGDGDDGETTVPPGYAAAGRTDAGVSAVAQTVAFDAPEWLSPAALNAELPADVRAWASADAPDGFHATHDATARSYTYHLYAPDAADGLAREAVEAFAGEHDFHNLTSDEEGTVRDLSTTVERDGEFLVLGFEAGGFPRQLVRQLVTVVDEVVNGERERTFLERVLSAEVLEGPEGIGPAPAAPLVLTDVEYPGLAFAMDEDAAASARDVFGKRQAELAAAARVCGQLGDL